MSSSAAARRRSASRRSGRWESSSHRHPPAGSSAARHPPAHFIGQAKRAGRLPAQARRDRSPPRVTLAREPRRGPPALLSSSTRARDRSSGPADPGIEPFLAEPHGILRATRTVRRSTALSESSARSPKYAEAIFRAQGSARPPDGRPPPPAPWPGRWHRRGATARRHPGSYETLNGARVNHYRWQLNPRLVQRRDAPLARSRRCRQCRRARQTPRHCRPVRRDQSGLEFVVRTRE